MKIARSCFFDELTSKFHLLALGAPIVVLIEHVTRDVHPVRNELLWRPVAKVLGDGSSPNTVRGSRAWARAGPVVVHHRLALVGLSIVGTTPILARARDLVAGSPDDRRRETAFSAGDQRSPSMIVEDVVPMDVGVVLDNLAIVVTDCDGPFRPYSVLEWRSGIWAVSEVNALCLGIEVPEVECTKTPESDPVCQRIAVTTCSRLV